MHASQMFGQPTPYPHPETAPSPETTTEGVREDPSPKTEDSKEASRKKHNAEAKFDVAIACDCVYKSDDRLLAKALARVCGEKTLVIMSFGERSSERKHGEPMSAVSWGARTGFFDEMKKKGFALGQIERAEGPTVCVATRAQSCSLDELKKTVTRLGLDLSCKPMYM